jgi:hypothetical protein
LLLVFFAALVLPAGAAVLYQFPPTETPIYPPCVFHLVTGLHCPGCGATRCAHALLHGDLPQALAYNPLLVLLLPLIAFGLTHLAHELWTGRRLPVPRLPGWTVQVLLWLILAFAVLRNVDVYPLNLLAPHPL